MGEFCDDVKTLLGEDLRAIGATSIKETVSGSGMDEKEVCYFSASNKIIAISHSTRDGATCWIRKAEGAELSQYETWDTLWHLLDMDKDFYDEPDGISAYLAMFPDEHSEYMKFMGSCLVKYFCGDG